jgi:hypothetical protein
MALKSKKEGFTYQKRDKEAVKERANMKGGNFDTIFKPKFKQWKPKEGKNTIRILPPTWDDARHYGLDIFINYNIGADNQSYLSLSKHGKGEDPLAEAKRDAQKEGDKDLVKALSPNQRILYWIIDRNDEAEGPLLWASPFTFDKSLANLCIDEDTKEVMMIDDPAEGNDVRFYKEGTGMLTKYDPSKMKVLKPSLLNEDEGLENDWLDFIAENPLPDTLNFYDYDHIKATFDGVVGKRDDDEEKPARSRKPVVEKDQDADDDRPVRSKRKPVDEDEVEEVKPRRRAPPVDEEEVKPAARRRPAPVVEDDEEEDEPAPPPKSRRGKTDDDEVGGSIRERLARRRSQPPADEDDD